MGSDKGLSMNDAAFKIYINIKNKNDRWHGNSPPD